MNRLLLTLGCFCLFATPAWGQSPCCDTGCVTDCCQTTMQTQVSYVPVTTYKCQKYVDQCGRCLTRRVPCTTYKKVCRTVPVTTCRPVAKPCCPPPVVACAPPPTCCPTSVAVAPRPRPRPLMVRRMRAPRGQYCCL